MKLALLSAGAPRHGRNITQQWQSISDENGWGWSFEFWEWKPNGFDDYDFASVQWAVWIGLFERCFEWMSMQSDCKHIGVFVGTDLLQHRELVARGYLDPFEAATLLCADAPHLVEEARALTGREVGYVRSIPPEAYQARPIEGWDRILGYVPVGREDFFRWSWILDIARDYPDIVFEILGRTPSKEDPENIVAHLDVSGEEKRRLFESSFAYLRPVEHDGIGLTLIEMGQLGRYLFHSDTRLYGVGPARSVGEIEFGIDEILRKKQQPDKRIADYYVREYSRERLADDLGRLRERMGETL